MRERAAAVFGSSDTGADILVTLEGNIYCINRFSSGINQSGFFAELEAHIV
jgi:hypothetical protein